MPHAPPQRTRMSPPLKDTTDHLHPAKKSGKIRTILVLAVVAILVASAAAGTHLYMAYRLPDPETADREGLFRWIITADLSEYPTEIHQVLIQRLEEEITKSSENAPEEEGDIDWDAIEKKLPEKYRPQLWNNAQILLRPWFFNKMDEYDAVSTSEKIEIIDQMLDQTKIWKGLIRFAPPGKIDKDKPGLCMAILLFGKTQEWKQDSTPEEAKRLDDFVAAIQARWLVRKCLGTLQ